MPRVNIPINIGFLRGKDTHMQVIEFRGDSLHVNV